jgi:hypothetical protein
MRSLRGARRGKLATDRSSGRDARLMKPDRFLDVFIAETADRINFIARYAPRHFEAAKFLFELAKALKSDGSGDLPRRA